MGNGKGVGNRKGKINTWFEVAWGKPGYLSFGVNRLFVFYALIVP